MASRAAVPPASETRRRQLFARRAMGTAGVGKLAGERTGNLAIIRTSLISAAAASRAMPWAHFDCDSATPTLLPPGIRAEGAGTSGPFTCPVPSASENRWPDAVSSRLPKKLRPNAGASTAVRFILSIRFPVCCKGVTRSARLAGSHAVLARRLHVLQHLEKWGTSGSIQPNRL